MIVQNVLLGLCLTGLAGAEPGLTAQKDADGARVVVLDGQTPVLRYNYATISPPDGYLDKVNPHAVKYAQPRSNYIHPLYGPHGEELTRDWADDHPHHRGIYWAWPEVKHGEKLGDLHALQHVFARPTGKLETDQGDDFAEITAENRWMWEDETPIVHELAIIRVHPADEQGRAIDLRFELTALVDAVTLARRGTTHYGGLNIRPAPVANQTIVMHADAADAEPRRSFGTIRGLWKGAEQPVALSIFPSRENPGYPGDWIEYPNLGWFQSTFPAANTRYPVPRDKPLVLRYRLWIHPTAEVSTETLQGLSDRYQ